jgi:hypothetical protein
MGRIGSWIDTERREQKRLDESEYADLEAKPKRDCRRGKKRLGRI